MSYISTRIQEGIKSTALYQEGAGFNAHDMHAVFQKTEGLEDITWRKISKTFSQMVKLVELEKYRLDKCELYRHSGIGLKRYARIPWVSDCQGGSWANLGNNRKKASFPK